MKGEVVGINTAIKTLGGGYEGVGFAVPSSRARRVASDLAEFGQVRRAYLGVTIRPIDPTSAEQLGSNAAALITSVTSPSPAAEAGIRPGDLIVLVDGRPIDGPAALQARIEVAKVGEPLTLTILRNGQNLVLSVKPEAQPERFNPTQTQQVSHPPGININVPGARISVPGPTINIGPPANPTTEGEPSLTPLPPAASASETSGVVPSKPTAEKPVIRSTPSNPESTPPADPGPKTSARPSILRGRATDESRPILIAARMPD
jgi:membrane-associated protease RseP (regulator of RpoE activity)